MKQLTGLRGWLLQRISAVYLGLYLPLALLLLWVHPPTDFAHWRATLQHPWVYLTTLLFVLATLAHAWVGLRNILLDYVRPLALRLVLLGLLAAALIILGAWLLLLLPTPF